MLNRTQLLVELQKVSHELFAENQANYELAKQLWAQIISDPSLAEKLSSAITHFALPQWTGALDATYACDPVAHYRCIGVDGSQIFPDRHQGISCSLINIGFVDIHYEAAKSLVNLKSLPHLFVGDKAAAMNAESLQFERDALEFKYASEYVNATAQSKPYVIFDGALLFWQLEAKDAAVKESYARMFCSFLSNLYTQKILWAHYTSLPKTKELSHILRTVFCSYNTDLCPNIADLEYLLDAHICQWYLKPGYYSNVFEHTGKLSFLYPAELKPHFFYLNSGFEIARIELPAWIARDATLVHQLANVIFDQAQKGHGYPVILSEAHEQAVIKGPDRDFFYQVITKLSIDAKHSIAPSRKQLKKRGIGI